MLRRKSRLLPGAIFFLLCYLYVWLFIEPNLVYHGFGALIPDAPLFSADWRFLGDSLEIPGGLTFYACGFLSQWYYYSPLGALIVILVALCLCELSRRHYIRAGYPGSNFLHYFPAVMIILIYNQYGHPLAACLACSVGLLFSLAFERMPLRSGPIRMLVFYLMAAVCYCLAGAGGALVFSLMTTVYLLFLRRDWLPAVLTLPVAAAIVQVLAEYVFHLSPKQEFLILTPFSRSMAVEIGTLSGMLIVMLYAFVPVTIMLICLWRMLFGKASDARVAQPEKTDKNKEKSRRAIPAYFRRFVLPVIPAAVLAFGLYFGYDETHRQI
ncbi:MAG: DUF6057 family protein, partial [Planctomycetota bacterium]